MRIWAPSDGVIMKSLFARAMGARVYQGERFLGPDSGGARPDAAR